MEGQNEFTDTDRPEHPAPDDLRPLLSRAFEQIKSSTERDLDMRLHSNKMNSDGTLPLIKDAALIPANEEVKSLTSMTPRSAQESEWLESFFAGRQQAKSKSVKFEKPAVALQTLDMAKMNADVLIKRLDAPTPRVISDRITSTQADENIREEFESIKTAVVYVLKQSAAKDALILSLEEKFRARGVSTACMQEKLESQAATIELISNRLASVEGTQQAGHSRTERIYIAIKAMEASMNCLCDATSQLQDFLPKLGIELERLRSLTNDKLDNGVSGTEAAKTIDKVQHDVKDLEAARKTQSGRIDELVHAMEDIQDKKRRSSVCHGAEKVGSALAAQDVRISLLENSAFTNGAAIDEIKMAFGAQIKTAGEVATFSGRFDQLEQACREQTESTKELKAEMEAMRKLQSSNALNCDKVTEFEKNLKTHIKVTSSLKKMIESHTEFITRQEHLTRRLQFEDIKTNVKMGDESEKTGQSLEQLRHARREQRIEAQRLNLR